MDSPNVNHSLGPQLGHGPLAQGLLNFKLSNLLELHTFELSEVQTFKYNL